MYLKLETIRRKHNLTIDELDYYERKIFRRKLQITKNNEALILEDLRLYIIANDRDSKIKNYYQYEVAVEERMVLERYRTINN